jgi:hypothetical protein
MVKEDAANPACEKEKQQNKFVLFSGVRFLTML